MWNSFFLVFLAIGGSLATEFFRDCDMKMCNGPPSTETTEQAITQAPNEEMLKLACSPLLKSQECEEGAIKNCTGKSLEEWSTSDNETMASLSALQLNMHGLIEDLCDEESLLHEGYVSSVDCFNEMMKVQHLKCIREAYSTYLAFEESQMLLGVVEEADGADCMITAHAVACFTIELREQCGEVARATMVEILKRIQYVTLGLGSCNTEQLNILRTTYLEFMEFEEQKKSWFSQVFNSRK